MVWRPLTRLWSEETKRKQGGRKREKVVWRPLTRLWSGETNKKGEGRRGEKSKDWERVVEMPNTSLVRQPTPG